MALGKANNDVNFDNIFQLSTDLLFQAEDFAEAAEGFGECVRLGGASLQSRAVTPEKLAAAEIGPTRLPN